MTFRDKEPTCVQPRGMQSVKLVVVGDSAIGKTSLLLSYVTNAFPGEYLPRVCDVLSCNVLVDGVPFELTVCDTCDEQGHERRLATYADAHVFLVAFSLIQRASLEHIATKWLPEVKAACPDAPVILVGLKHDLREEPTSETHVTEKEGEQVAKEVGAQLYLEVSCLNRHNFKRVFDESVRLAFFPSPPKQNKKCLVL